MLPAYAGMIRLTPEGLDKAPRVLPAYAGMIRSGIFATSTLRSAPRVCGDDPGKKNLLPWVKACSPRMRG